MKDQSKQEATGLKQGIFGPQAIWVALILFVIARTLGKTPVGHLLAPIFELIAYVINIGWTARVANEKGWPLMTLWGFLPMVGPLVVACVSPKPGSLFDQKSGKAIHISDGTERNFDSDRCSNCNALLSPTMLTCPRCGQARTINVKTIAFDLPDQVKSEAKHEVPKEAVPETITAEPVLVDETRLEKLYKLYESGAITEDEFKRLKDMQ